MHLSPVSSRRRGACTCRPQRQVLKRQADRLTDNHSSSTRPSSSFLYSLCFIDSLHSALFPHLACVSLVFLALLLHLCACYLSFLAFLSVLLFRLLCFSSCRDFSVCYTSFRYDDCVVAAFGWLWWLGLLLLLLLLPLLLYYLYRVRPSHSTYTQTYTDTST